MASEAGVTPRYIMIGGFLGAGKTTLILKLAEHLSARGLRPGLITNDQGAGLVDTALVRSNRFATEEIAGGCFCCRFDSLVEAAGALARETRPDVFIAEPVGSCTDLVASVSHPLRHLYGDDFVVAPLSVVLDPIRALRMFGLEEGGTFSRKIAYLYHKQLEEARILVINKTDLLDEERLNRLSAVVQERYPTAEVFTTSARLGRGLDPWFERIMTTEQPGGATMDLDYDIYAEAEAMLGWLNCTVHVSAPRLFDGRQLVTYVAREIHQRLSGLGYEIAHLKMVLSRDDSLDEVLALNVVRNDFVPEVVPALAERLASGRLLINLRAEAPPDRLRTAVMDALERRRQTFESLTLDVQHLEHFQPARPQPTHRMATG